MAFFDRVAELERTHASFAIATVVARRSPVSSHVGDQALVVADGRMEGFVGGSCSRDIVRRQALAAMRNGKPVLLQIRPDASAGSDAQTATNAEMIVIPMSCSSEGAVDVYIEPRVPQRRLIVVGFTPVADALARLAATLEYDVVRFVADEEFADITEIARARVFAIGALRDYLDRLDVAARSRLVAIVASQGHYDEIALAALLAGPIAFAGLLASRRRAATVTGVLAQEGVPADRIATIRTPVGLDIGARSPGEVAVSILAEIIAATPLLSEDAPQAGAETTTPASALDPVCGMMVEIASTRHRLERNGTTSYFCCAGCRAAFAADPAHA
ncbi:MAG: XdhC family protein [Candidatus Velthaea sp.]